MFYKLIKAYKDNNIDIHLGNINLLCSCMAQDGKMLMAGGGISITDVAFFFGLSKIFTPSRIFCIGNAFGYGAFVLAEIFDCLIDVIDAEIEGEFNPLGSELTRKISKEYYQDRVQLFTGFSPQDLASVIEEKKYDLVFIDGEHTNQQQILDFNGMQPFVKDSIVFYLHDVELTGMQESFNDLKNQYYDYNGYDVDFSTFGCKAMIRNLPQVKEWLELVKSSPIDGLQNPKACIHYKIPNEPFRLENNNDINVVPNNAFNGMIDEKI